MRARAPFSRAASLSVAIAAGSMESTFLLSALSAAAACSAVEAVPMSTLIFDAQKVPSG